MTFEGEEDVKLNGYFLFYIKAILLQNCSQTVPREVVLVCGVREAVVNAEASCVGSYDEELAITRQNPATFLQNGYYVIHVFQNIHHHYSVEAFTPERQTSRRCQHIGTHRNIYTDIGFRHAKSGVVLQPTPYFKNTFRAQSNHQFSFVSPKHERLNREETHGRYSRSFSPFIIF
ncbi:MAG: hypothetical protein RMI49_02455 [Candidatus Caldarchaeum sp.]|nr:hypothetical protein [Candidatus Caldarchaeum sp.]